MTLVCHDYTGLRHGAMAEVKLTGFRSLANGCFGSSASFRGCARQFRFCTPNQKYRCDLVTGAREYQPLEVEQVSLLSNQKLKAVLNPIIACRRTKSFQRLPDRAPDAFLPAMLSCSGASATCHKARMRLPHSDSPTQSKQR